MADRAKFLDFLDMIDGGGAGQRGDQFEGGGIFSMLANLMPINPYGSEDPTRRRARDAFYGGLLGDSPDTVSAAEAAATPSVVRQDVSGVRPTVMVGSMPAAPQNMVRPEFGVGGMPAARSDASPSVMSVGPAQPTSAGVPMGQQPQMQTSMVGGTGFEEGDMRGRIGGTISGGVTPSVLGSPSLRQPPMEAQPMTFEEFAQKQSILPSVGLDQLRNLYENYLSFIRRNNTIGNLTK